jgi:dTDP-4-amino-4,6-dideoxygalactose transaminase
MKYDPWPLGQVPKELQRPELGQLKKIGYEFSDAREVVDIFEKKVARFAGSKYAVAVDCCSHGIFLSLMYLIDKGEIDKKTVITIPRRTYVSIPMQILNAGVYMKLEDSRWVGVYNLKGTRIWDGAVRWTEGMFVGGNALQVVSFQIKKRIPIGRGGMILTDDKRAYDKLKLISYDGRDLNVPYDSPDHVKRIGYHMYMTPEDAARGIILMDNTPLVNEDSANWESYPDVEQMLSNIK